MGGKGPKAHSKNSDFGTPSDLGTLYWPLKKTHAKQLNLSSDLFTFNITKGNASPRGPCYQRDLPLVW